MSTNPRKIYIAERLFTLLNERAWASFEMGRRWWWKGSLWRWFGVCPVSGDGAEIRRENEAVAALVEEIEALLREEIAAALRRTGPPTEGGAR